MKKLLLPFIACVIGIIFSSFSRRDTCFYLIYISGPQNSYSSYGVTTVQPASCAGNEVLCWIRICKGDNVLTEADFNFVFEFLDVVNDFANTLDDDVEKDFGSTHLEKKDRD
jgi:hypothetical protein